MEKPSANTPVNVVLVVPSPTSSGQTILPNILPAPPAYPYATPSPSVNSPLKPAKKFRSVQEKILRCKRRIEFGQLSSVLDKPRASTQLRRNERERKRVGIINNTFANLRKHVPDDYCASSSKNAKKLSKVDTLRGAIDYIRCLQSFLDDHNAMDNVVEALSSTPSRNEFVKVEPMCPPLVIPDTVSLPSMSTPTSYTTTVPLPVSSEPGILQPISLNTINNRSLSIDCTSQNILSCSNSPKSFNESDYSDPPLSPEDEDLLSFATMWLQDQKH